MIPETERLILRPFTVNDAADAFEYLSRISINCFMSMKINSMEEAVKEMEKRVKENDELYFAIELKETCKVIGEIFTHGETSNFDENRKDTYSPCWMLNDEYTGKGYAYEAAYALYDYLFNVLDARRIYAYTEDYNISSQKLCERLGMRKEGMFMEYVTFVSDEKGEPIYENTMQWAILSKEWKEKH
ncbi:MAG: GNAT family protein [Clostridia bacterium]|nr:GNAT family protein [Clostridia bacterium]